MSSAPDDVLHLLRQRGRNPDPSALDCPDARRCRRPRGPGRPGMGRTGRSRCRCRTDPGAHGLARGAGAGRRRAGRLARAGCAPGRAARRARSAAASTASSCRAPTSIRASTCRAARSGWRWLTGFSGSAGLAIVLADRAAIFIDGRYTLAVRAQVDTDAFVPHQIPEESPEAWIAENLPKGGKLGFDPWLVTVDGHERFARACQRAGGEFVPVDSNPVDAVWRDRPPRAAGAGAAASRRVRRREQRGQAHAHRRHRQGQGRRRGADHRSRIRSPGCSTCAAATCRARRSRWASRCCTATAMSISTWTAARCPTARWPGWATP